MSGNSYYLLYIDIRYYTYTDTIYVLIDKLLHIQYAMEMLSDSALTDSYWSALAAGSYEVPIFFNVTSIKQKKNTCIVL